jgi:hypothetical protein
VNLNELDQSSSLLLTRIDDGQINSQLLTIISSEHQGGASCSVPMNTRPLTNYAGTRSRWWGDAPPTLPKRKAPLVFVVLWWISVLTVIVGAILLGICMAVAVGQGWLLWCYVPTLADMLEAASEMADYDSRDPR